uniref:Zn(2)-C6 fungal-type domain-containing protein n=1 Tax=Bionectria ochroleuca TaxID=29856 RepID=A0A0B7KI89_BIOOC
MVGVPGKSTACPDCRKRRRPCDRERPACGQCRRAGVECGGYGKPWIFVNSTVEQDDGIVLELRKKSYSMELEPVPKPTSRPLERRFINAIKAQINGRPVVLPQSLNRTSYEEIFVESFWSTYLPSPGAHSSKEAVLYNTSDWIHVVRDLYRDNGPLRMIFLANCVALKGFEDNKQWLVEKSHQMHGRALNAIARSLCHPDAYKSDAVLAAARMLILFEICYGESLVTATPQSRRWHTHGAGHMAIMYSRGPHCYKRGYAHQLFCDARLHQVICRGWATQAKMSFIHA